jgi:hypothetical protein
MKDDDYIFTKRFKKLFGKESLEQLEQVKDWIKTTFNPFSKNKTTYYNDIYTGLFRKLFCHRIVNHIGKTKNRGRFEHNVTSNESSLDAHLNRTKGSSTWGGELEIRAMSELLDCCVKVTRDGVDLPPYGTYVRLFHAGATSASREANHYHFEIKKSLGEAYQAAIKSVVSPRHKETTMFSMKRGGNPEKGDSEQSRIEELMKKIRIHPPLEDIPAHDIDELEPTSNGKRFKPSLSEGVYDASGFKPSLHGIVYQLKLLMLFLK